MNRKIFLTLVLLLCTAMAFSQHRRTASKYDLAAIRDFRYKLMEDPYRPSYHFAIPEDYADPFDPNGCIYWNGRYHMFYIYQHRGEHVFGHLSSVDMVHWVQHPKALYPTAETKVKGIFSGNCFVNREGVPTMLFHGLKQGNSLAFSSDPLLEKWKQLPSNPIVPNPECDTLYRSWDPCGWLEGDTYYAIFGGRRPAIFKAKELDQWSYVGDLFGSYLPSVSKKEDVSCADFFDLGGKKVLLCISHYLGARYYVGTWKDEKFYPETHGRMSFEDNTYFAPESLLTPDGRRVMWSWIYDAREKKVIRESGWSGMMSLPRELFMKKDNTLGMRPVKELHALRYNERNYKNLVIDGSLPLNGVTGDARELYLEIDPKEASQCGVRILESGDGKEYGLIYYDARQKELVIDASRLNAIGMEERTLMGQLFKKVEKAPFELRKGEKLKLNIFIDKCVVEVYANESLALVRTNAFSSKDSAKEISLFSKGGAARCSALQTWEMIGTNPY